jgi:hypothetical protein
LYDFDINAGIGSDNSSDISVYALLFLLCPNGTRGQYPGDQQG